MSIGHPRPAEVLAKFGWCLTSHHGTTETLSFDTGLCPGWIGKLTCACSCHQGVEPDFRARVHKAEDFGNGMSFDGESESVEDEVESESE